MTFKISRGLLNVRRVSADTRNTMIFPLLLIIVGTIAAAATLGQVNEREHEPTAFDWMK